MRSRLPLSFIAATTWRRSRGDGLEAAEEVDAVLVHLLLELIDLLVIGDGDVAEVFVAIEQAAEGVAQVALAEAGHHEQIVLQCGEGGVVGAEDVSGCVCHGLSLSESTTNIVFRLLLARAGEKLVGIVEFDEPAKIKEGGFVRDAAGLLHVVGDDDDGVIAAQLVDQFLDLHGGDGVEGGGGLVHEEDLRLGGDGAGDAKPLLLAAGEADAGLAEIVLHLVPEGGHAEGLLHAVAEEGAVADAVEAQADGDVLGDGHGGEGIGLLEDHADAAADDRGIDLRGVKVLAEEADGAGHAGLVGRARASG